MAFLFEFTPSSIFALTFSFLAFTLALLSHCFSLPSNSKPRLSTPPSPPAWPFLGHLPLLARSRPYSILAHLSDLYSSPLLFLRLGRKPAVVACTAHMAREFLHTHDATFSHRPEFGVADHLLFGKDNIIGFQDSGPRWRSLRKLWTTQLLSQAMMAKNQHVRHEEVAFMLAAVKEEAAASDIHATGINVLNCVAQLTGNIMGRLLLSHRLFDSVRRPHPLHSIVEDTLRLMFTPLVGDFVPLLSFLDLSTKRKMARTRSRFEEMVASVVSERQQQRANFDDILDLLLAEGAGLSEVEARRFISGTLLEMFIAGVDTSANTVTWAMAELLNNPNEMVKLQQEIEQLVGLNRIVNESDLPKLHYLKAIIKETFRLHPVAVMMIPHASKEDCKVGGYFIPAQTRVLINLWAVGRDKAIWEFPHAFQPQRFIASPIDVKGKHFGLLPFGSGRRMCPGMAQGLTVVELALANLVHCFNWSSRLGNAIDLSESTSSSGSLTLATPLIAVPSFRLNMSHFP